MKYFVVIPILVILILTSFSKKISQNIDEKNKKHALIIALSNYDRTSTGWSPIHAKNDIPLMRSALIYQGFDTTNIMVLDQKDGTKAGIVKTFEKFTSMLKKGDAVVIHFSTHGQQIKDDNGDEVDGLDESIVTLGASVKPNFNGNGYDGSEHLRDDVIGELLGNIRNKIGKEGNVFVIMDACQSGTASRGDVDQARGTNLIFGTAADTKSKYDDEEPLGLISNDEDLATMVCFFGSSADQLNYETTNDDGEPVGSLSYAVSKALVEADQNTSYEKLFDLTRSHMAGKSVKNIPQKEGDLNQEILGGAMLPKSQHYSTKRTDATNKRVMINAGNLHGVFKKSLISFYPPDTYVSDTSRVTPIAMGYVLQTTAIAALVQIDTSIEIKEDILNSSWAYVSKYELNFPEQTKVAFNKMLSNELKEKLVNYFAENKVINFVDLNENPDLIVEKVVEENTDYVQIYAKNQDVIFKKKNTEANLSNISDAIMDYTHSRFIRGIECNNTSLQAKLELIPITVEPGLMGGWSITEKFEPITKKDDANNIIFRPGDVYRIKITNTSNQTIYFSVLDIYPNGFKKCLVPDIENNTISESECQLLKGQSIELPNVEKGVGYVIDGEYTGKETLKLIVTDQPWGICDVIESKGTTKGDRGPGEMNPLEVLFSESFKLETTRSTSLSAPSGGATISTLSYQIVPDDNAE